MLLQQVPHRPPHEGIHAARGLVQHDESRLTDECQRNVQSAAPSSGQGSGWRAGRQRPGKSDILQEACRGSRAPPAAPQRSRQSQVLGRGEVIEEHVVLGAHAEVPARLARLGGNIGAVDGDLALRGSHSARKHTHRSGLPRTVVPQQGQDLTFGESQVQPPHRDDEAPAVAAVLLADLAQLYCASQGQRVLDDTGRSLRHPPPCREASGTRTGRPISSRACCSRRAGPRAVPWVSGDAICMWDDTVQVHPQQEEQHDIEGQE
mmetsp:Transcript_17547/g.61342  ORF Transcript_17547/g.61342 Transcript_17547/m.61342 type:complete len:263 (+) Transcript_17547:528-1316(+)